MAVAFPERIDPGHPNLSQALVAVLFQVLQKYIAIDSMGDPLLPETLQVGFHNGIILGHAWHFRQAYLNQRYPNPLGL